MRGYVDSTVLWFIMVLELLISFHHISSVKQKFKSTSLWDVEVIFISFMYLFYFCAPFLLMKEPKMSHKWLKEQLD